MSILNGTTNTTNPPLNRWTDRVRVVSVCPPWWETSSVQGVAEVSVANTFTCLVHVARGKNNGRWFANMPSSKREGEWIPNFTIDDPELGKAIADAAIGAVQAMSAAAPVAAATVRTAVTAPPPPDDDFPF
jgi:hypothetical protein